MDVLLYIIFIIAGLAIGSFLNVIIYRLPRKSSIIIPSSFCPSCKSRIKFYDNIPILSYLILKGRCRQCKAKISLRYPAVEIIAAILFALNFYFFGISLSCLAGIFLSIALIIVSFIDIEMKLIPNVIVLPFTLIGLSISISSDLERWWIPIAYSAGAFLFMFIINLIYPKGMGMGDVKLSMMAGAFLSEKIIPGLFIGFLAGSLIGILLIILKRKKFRQSIAFGPFISFGCIAALFYGDKIINWYLAFI
ncbi:MAG: prepilin peptidase [Actinomycetota bacterium]|jgi:leader peptidase (prepilin peptidase)/N-methyltransferase|nr:prepilin peptidase [Actinomycetota bacterium]